MKVLSWEPKDMVYEEQYNVLTRRLFPWSGVPDESFGGAWIALAGNESSTPHAHDEYEIFFIVEGEGTMLINDEEKKVHLGDTIFIPSFHQHSLTNDCSERLLFLSIWWGGSISYQPG